MHANHWRRDYDRIVSQIITSSRGVTVTELCRSTGLLSDEISDVTDRLLARGVIERDVREPDTFTA
jgi:predicted transcriptional regulator